MLRGHRKVTESIRNFVVFLLLMLCNLYNKFTLEVNLNQLCQMKIEIVDNPFALTYQSLFFVFLHYFLLLGFQRETLSFKLSNL